MTELEQLLESVERNLDAERCTTALPRLLELCGSDNLARTKIYLLAARCYFVARDQERYSAMLSKAFQSASVAPIEAQVRVAATEASLLTHSLKLTESEEKLGFALEHINEVPDDLRSLILSIHGRNEVLSGNYAEAIEHSQEAIQFAAPLSATSAFAHGTIALVFQMMGRIEESEQFGLEQIRILTERGSTDWVASLFSFLSSGAASIQQWKRAQHYEEKAMELMKGKPARSSIRTLSLLWMSNSQLDHGNYSKAIEYGNDALDSANEESNTLLLMNAQILLGRIHFTNRDYDRALDLLQRPLEREAQLSDITRMHLFQWLAATYKALDRKVDAFDICWRLWELQSDFDSRTREALLRYHRGLEKKIHAQETALLKSRSDGLERELSLQTMSLAAQVDMLARFRDDLRLVVRNVNDPSAALRQIKDKLKSLPCQQIDWSKFEMEFTSVHPDFRKLLLQKFPELTPQELRICQLLRVGMKSFEVGRLICISERGVESHRANIRKKFSLKTEQSLTEFLTALA